MTEVLQPVLKNCVVVYFDDILVFSKIREDHLKDLDKVFGILGSHSLKINLKKCEFMVAELPFLGFIVGKGLKVDHRKTEAIDQWPVLHVQLRSEVSLGWLLFTEGLSKISAPSKAQYQTV